MPTLPNSKVAQIEFFEQHNPVWQANFAAIGLTAPEVNNLIALTDNARTAYEAALAARQASKGATTAADNAHRQMRDLGGALINTIRAFAESTSNPTVYATAQIPPPAPPSPVPPPEQPDDLSGAIDPFGVITLKWKATPKGKSTGVFFFIERKVGGGVWTPIGATQEAQFLDSIGEPIEAGDIVQYRVQARRGTDASPWSDPLSVDFGGQDSIAGFVGESGGDGASEAA